MAMSNGLELDGETNQDDDLKTGPCVRGKGKKETLILEILEKFRPKLSVRACSAYVQVQYTSPSREKVHNTNFTNSYQDIESKSGP